MSYFKPLNSNENNLHIIRASIDNTGTIVQPTSNQLPRNFYSSSVEIDAKGNAFITITYPLTFNPSDIPSVFVENQSAKNMYTLNKTNSSVEIHSSTSTFSNIDVAIIGQKSNGPVFAVSNRGWKYSTRNQNYSAYDDLIYTDMFVGINTDNPTFNITTAGNICYIPNKVTNTSIDSMNLLNSYLNIIDINTPSNTTISLPTASNDGQLINITIGNVTQQNTYVILDTTTNIINNIANLQLQNKGDSINLCSYNNSWLITGYNIQTAPSLVNPAVRYNNINASSFSFNAIANGLLTILNLDANLIINLPVSGPYNGYVVEMVVGNANIVQNNTANLLVGNIITNKSFINLSNISDKIKLIGTLNGWLVI